MVSHEGAEAAVAEAVASEAAVGGGGGGGGAAYRGGAASRSPSMSSSFSLAVLSIADQDHSNPAMLLLAQASSTPSKAVSSSALRLPARWHLSAPVLPAKSFLRLPAQEHRTGFLAPGSGDRPRVKFSNS